MVSQFGSLNLGHNTYTQNAPLGDVHITTPSGVINLATLNNIQAYTSVTFNVYIDPGNDLHTTFSTNSVILTNIMNMGNVGFTVTAGSPTVTVNPYFIVKICNLSNAQLSDTLTIAYLIC